MKRWACFAFSILASAPWANAGAILDWQFDPMNGRGWTDANYSSIRSMMCGAEFCTQSNTAVAGLSAAGWSMAGSVLNKYDVLVIAQPPAPTNPPPDLTALGNWVRLAGHTLLLFTDSGDTGLPGANYILSKIGSSMQFLSDVNVADRFTGGGVTLADSVFGYPGLAGKTLQSTAGLKVTGGTAIAGDVVHWEWLGAGRVFAIGDRIENNYFKPDASNVNGQFFLPVAAPEPSTWVMFAAGGLALALYRRRLSR